MKWNEWVLGHLSAHISKAGPGEPPEDGEMNESDTGFEIRPLAVWGRARYLSVTEAPHNIEPEKKQFVSFKQTGVGLGNHNLRLSKQAVLTSTPGPPPNKTNSSTCAHVK